MSPEARDALRLLAGLVAADLRAGSPALARHAPTTADRPRGRGRPRNMPFAVAASSLARAA